MYGQNHIKFSTRIKAILFDLDNTLIQTRKADVMTCNKVSSDQMASKVGLDMSKELNLKQTFIGLMKKGFPFKFKLKFMSLFD